MNSCNSSAPELVLSAKELTLSYGSQPVLRGVNLEVHAGESIAIVGPSGCGKSSLMYCLAGLEYPTGGEINLCGQDLWSKNDEERASIRLRQCGFVFQSSDLMAELTLRDNIALPYELLGYKRKFALARADDLLKQLNIQEAAHRRPAQVSGGQRQRAAVARALIGSPAVVFADEPTGALDSSARENVLEAMLNSVKKAGAALIMVTHDEKAAGQVDRIVSMLDGKINS